MRCCLVSRAGGASAPCNRRLEPSSLGRSRQLTRARVGQGCRTRLDQAAGQAEHRRSGVCPDPAAWRRRAVTHGCLGRRAWREAGLPWCAQGRGASGARGGRRQARARAQRPGPCARRPRVAVGRSPARGELLTPWSPPEANLCGRSQVPQKLEDTACGRGGRVGRGHAERGPARGRAPLEARALGAKENEHDEDSRCPSS